MHLINAWALHDTTRPSAAKQAAGAVHGRDGRPRPAAALARLRAVLFLFSTSGALRRLLARPGYLVAVALNDDFNKQRNAADPHVDWWVLKAAGTDRLRAASWSASDARSAERRRSGESLLVRGSAEGV